MDVLEGFVHNHLAEVTVLARPRASGPTRVLHVQDRRGAEWFAKRLTSRQQYHQEVHAYRAWSHLPAVDPPVAVDDETQSLLLSAVPGSPVDAGRRCGVWSAGRLLSRMHAVGATRPVDRWQPRLKRKARRHLRELSARGERIDDRAVLTAIDEMTSITALPTALNHGDFQPGNWLCHRRRLRVFDFAEATVRPVVHDFTRLRYGPCWDREPLFGRCSPATAAA